eukprot:scaffold74842_cov42-Cyclotella_meneghiniana.AAC.1
MPLERQASTPPVIPDVEMGNQSHSKMKSNKSRTSQKEVCSHQHCHCSRNSMPVGLPPYSAQRRRGGNCSRWARAMWLATVMEIHKVSDNMSRQGDKNYTSDQTIPHRESLIN